MQCPRCQAENRPQAKFCEGCATPLARTCANCGTQLSATAKFCPECAHSVAGPAAVQPRFGSPESYTPKHLAEKILTSKSALEGERKQVTVLFADLKGSMELLADRDPEEARRLLDPVLERMMEAVHRYEGTVNQVMGDGIMALFGAPLAHEDHAVRACYAALRMQESVARYGDEIQRAGGVPVQIRVGLNSGEVVVRSIGNDLHMDYTAVGQTTHLAARMEQMAKPGSILLTAEALRLAEGFVQVKPLGPVPVKGLEAPIEVYEIIGAGPVRRRLEAAVARGLTRFVGRDAELDQLRKALERVGQGHGQVVAVVGEPGVGKSRLFYEFTHSHRTHGWLILESGSVSYGKATTYLPVIDLLKACFQIEARDDARKIREKVMGKLLALDEALRPALPAFLSLLDVPVEDPHWQDLDPPQRRQRTLEAVKRLLVQETQVQPLCLVFEDLHWIDSETQVVLDSLIESLPTARLLLLVNYRPEYQHGWGSKTYYTQLRIDPLPPESAEELLQGLVGKNAELQPFRQLLIKRTEGNPFFLEESVRTLVETHVLVGEPGAYRLAEPVQTVQVPATVQAVLAARIDRLPPEDKRLLQSASVIGEDVSFPLLQAVVDMPEEELRRTLSRLQTVEFLYETSLFPDLEYTFKHGLTYQVTYNSLLQERRRALHARTVAALEALYPDRLAEQVERLAHHAFRSEVWPEAVAYLHQAGTKAMARSAYGEALGFFQQALSALAHLPENMETLMRTIDILVELGPALMATKGFTAPEVEASYNRARGLCDRVGGSPQLFPVLWGLWMFNQQRGQTETAQELGEQLLTVAEREGDPSLLLQAHHALWTTLQQHRSHAFRYGGHDPGVCCRNFLARTLWLLGYPDQALQSAQEALSLARELSQPLTTALALNSAAWTHYHRGEREDAAARAEGVVALAGEQGFSVWMAHGSMLLGRLMVEERRGEEGIAQLHRGLAAITRQGVGGREVFFLCLLADAYGKQHQTEKALEVLAEALAKTETHIEHYYEPELHRLRGELLADVASQDAQTCFRQAIDVARRQSAKSLELRALISLSRLWRQQGKKEAVREILGETYGWFTEGFDTADLKEAKALLEELS